MNRTGKKNELTVFFFKGLLLLLAYKGDALTKHGSASSNGFLSGMPPLFWRCSWPANPARAFFAAPLLARPEEAAGFLSGAAKQGNERAVSLLGQLGEEAKDRARAAREQLEFLAGQGDPRAKAMLLEFEAEQ